MSRVAASAEDRRIRALRPPRPAAVDPWRPIDVVREEERLPGGGHAQVLVVFLAGQECPFTCVFCDLWRSTTEERTPPGAIPAQIEEALRRVPPADAGSPAVGPCHAKLYNASNFFDEGAVPRADDAAILHLLAPFGQVVLECHPRLVGRRAFDFAAGLDGRLQVAMGLETVHPDALPRLNKKTSVEAFDRAAAALRERGIGIRAFVLVGAPFIPPGETVEWTERSVVHALEQGAEHVALIPVRGGNGELERLARDGEFAEPTLEALEDALDRCLSLGDAVVTVDTWDLERFGGCRRCRAERQARLTRMNLTGRREPAVVCDCGTVRSAPNGIS